MSQELPCLFCFSRSASPQRTHHPTTAFLQDKPRVRRCYQFLCSLLDIPSTLPRDGERHLLDPFSSIPLCYPCSSTFRNLSDLQDELQNIQRQITLVAEDIRSKVRSSDQDGSSSSLALAIQSITGEEGHPSASDSFNWMQQFRERVVFSSSIACPIFTHDQQISHNFVLVDLGRNQPPESVLSSNFGNDFGDAQDIQLQETLATVEPVKDGDQDWSHADSRDEIETLKESFSNPSKRRSKKLKINNSSSSPVSKSAALNEDNLRSCKKRVDESNLRFKCRYCCKRFLSMFSLRVHLPMHTGQLGYHCEQCKSSFANSSAIQVHNLVAHGSKKPYICSICKVERATQTGLDHHKKSHSLDEETKGPPFVCLKCPVQKEFSTKKILKRHFMEIHQSRNKFQCPVCSKHFSRKDDMCRHLVKSHRNAKLEDTPQKKFQCTLCPVVTEFRTSEDLTNHILAHGALQPIMCYICRIAFTTRLEFIAHNQEFHGVDPLTFKCPKENCDITLYSKVQVEAHIKLHNDKTSSEQPTRTYTTVQCDHCGKTFCDSSTLKRHIKDVHQKEPKIFYFSENDELEEIQSSPNPVNTADSEIEDAQHSTKNKELRSGIFKCHKTDCLLSFATAGNLTRHLKYVHESGDSQRFKCSDCNSCFKRKYDFMKHVRMKGHHQVNFQ